MRSLLEYIFLLAFAIVIKGQRYSNRDEDLNTPSYDYSVEQFPSQTVPTYHKTSKPNSIKLERYQHPFKPKPKVNKIKKQYNDELQVSYKTIKPIYETNKLNHHNELQDFTTTLIPDTTENNENYDYYDEIQDSRKTFKPTKEINTDATATLLTDDDNSVKSFTTSATITDNVYMTTKQQEININEDINSTKSNISINTVVVSTISYSDSTYTTIDTLISTANTTTDTSVPNTNSSNVDATNVTAGNPNLASEKSNVTLYNVTAVASNNTIGNNSEVNSSWPLINNSSGNASLDLREEILQNGIAQLFTNQFKDISGQLTQLIPQQYLTSINNIQNPPNTTSQLGNLNAIVPIQPSDNVMQDLRNPSKNDLSQLSLISRGKRADNNMAEFKDYIKSVLSFMQILSKSKQYECYQFMYCLLQDVFEYIAYENEAHNKELSSIFISLASLFDGASNYPISETYEKNCAKRFQDKCTDVQL